MPARKGSSRGVDPCTYRDGIDDEKGRRRAMAGGEAEGCRRGTKGCPGKDCAWELDLETSMNMESTIEGIPGCHGRS